jgi:hypothetical protein
VVGGCAPIASPSLEVVEIAVEAGPHHVLVSWRTTRACFSRAVLACSGRWTQPRKGPVGYMDVAPHRALFEGLEPDTEYRIEIVVGPTADLDGEGMKGPGRSVRTPKEISISGIDVKVDGTRARGARA